MKKKMTDAMKIKSLCKAIAGCYWDLGEYAGDEGDGMGPDEEDVQLYDDGAGDESGHPIHIVDVLRHCIQHEKELDEILETL